MQNLQTNAYVFFVGIDMSKQKFDVAILDKNAKKIGHNVFGNNPNGFTLFSAWIIQKVQDSNTLFCMEYTGIYSRKLWHFIQDKQWKLWMESGFEIKRKAGIKKTKTDKSDAFMIAEYSLSNVFKVKVTDLYDENIELLHDLLSARNRLISALQTLKTPLFEMKTYGDARQYLILENIHQPAMKGIEESLKSLEIEIDNLIKCNSHWHENIELVCSINGIGRVVCLWVLVYTRNFHADFNSRKFASLAGVAPFVSESGSSVKNGSHNHHFSHKFLKGIFHTATMAAIRSNKPIKLYFTKKKAEGKKGFVAMNNAKNKLIHQIFAVVKSKTMFNNEFIHPKAA